MRRAFHGLWSGDVSKGYADRAERATEPVGSNVRTSWIARRSIISDFYQSVRNCVKPIDSLTERPKTTTRACGLCAIGSAFDR